MFNPAEPLDVLDWVIDDMRLILIMKREPRLWRPELIDSALRKIEAVRKRMPRARTSAWKWTAASKPTTSAVWPSAGANTFGGQRRLRQAQLPGVINAMRAQLG